MALFDNAWYVDYGNGTSTGYYAVAKRGQSTPYNAGDIVRQFTAPAVGSERCFICIVAGTTANTTDATWTLTRGATTVDSGVTWQECTGASAVNGDLTNTPNWTTVKQQAITKGQIIKRDNGASYQICSTAGTGTASTEPSFSDTAGVTTADGATLVWTSLGVVGNFTGWQAPFARLASSFTSTWGRAGNTFFVASEHAETQATSITLTDPGTLVAPCQVLCVAKTPVPPTSATTGATITNTTAGNYIFSSSFVYYQGIEFIHTVSAGSMSLQQTTQNYSYFKNCKLTRTDTGAGNFLVTNAAAGPCDMIFDNCILTFGSNTGQTINFTTNLGRVMMRGGSFAVGANVPTTLFTSINGLVILEGVDLSAFGSGKTIVGAAAVTRGGQFIAKNCRLNASVTFSATQLSTWIKVYNINSDSSVNYRTEQYDSSGALTTETTIIRTGGASDGVQGISYKIITTSNCSWLNPFETLPLRIWNDTIGSVTVTVYGIWGGGAVPNNDDIFMVVDYLGTSGNPMGVFDYGTKADPLSANGALSSDTSTWGGSTTKFKMTKTVTVNNAGYITVYIRACKAATTFYVDPKIVLS